MTLIAEVFNPEKEKLQSFTFDKGWGKLKVDESPSKANFSMIGPPGYPSCIAFATLSKHSPAESSMVEPRVINFLALFTRTRAVFPPDTSKHK